MKTEELKKVQIKWVDSARCDGWQFFEDVEANNVECESVGYLVKETEQGFVISSTIGINPPQVCQYISIPKCAVKDYKEISI